MKWLKCTEELAVISKAENFEQVMLNVAEVIKRRFEFIIAFFIFVELEERLVPFLCML